MNYSTSNKVIIIGAGLGGISTAVYLSKKGFDVTIYEADARSGGRANIIEKNGFRFDTGPSLLNYPWVFEELFNSVEKNFYDYVELLKVDPSVSFYWFDNTHFQLSSDLHKLVTEYERLEPDSAPGLFRFLHNASIRYRYSFDYLVQKNANSYLQWISGVGINKLLSLGVTHSFYRDLQKYFKSRYICEALGSYGMYLGGSPFDLPGIFSILPYGELAYGLTLPKGGIYSIVQAIEKLAYELGIKIFHNSPVKKIRIENNKVLGIELQNDTFIESSIVVSNVDVPTTYTELMTSVDKSINNVLMTPSVLTFYWGVKGKIKNLPHHTIFLPNNYKKAFRQLVKDGAIPDEMPFYCSVPSATDPTLAPTNNSVVFVLIPVPVLSKLGNVNWDNTILELKQKVLDRLKNHSIELNQQQIIFEEIFTPLDWKNKFGLFDGSAFGAAHTLFQMGPKRMKNYDPKIRGLFFVGASTTPGTGMPMVVISGKMTAERVIKYVR